MANGTPKARGFKELVRQRIEQDAQLRAQPESVVNARVLGRPGMRGTATDTNSEDFTVLKLNRSPSPVQITPWNNITLIFRSTSVHCLTFGELVRMLQKQIDPNDHALGIVRPYTLPFDDVEHFEMSLDLEIAEELIRHERAFQIRIRQIKVWAENTHALSVSIFEPREKYNIPQSVIKSYKEVESEKQTRTFGCKLPKYMRDTVLYSLDYANHPSTIVESSAASGSTITTHLSIEWKIMTMTREEYFYKVHFPRFRKEIFERTEKDPVPHNTPCGSERGVNEKEERPSSSKLSQQDIENNCLKSPLMEVPSKVMREWASDPLVDIIKEEEEAKKVKIKIQIQERNLEVKRISEVLQDAKITSPSKVKSERRTRDKSLQSSAGRPRMLTESEAKNPTLSHLRAANKQFLDQVELEFGATTKGTEQLPSPPTLPFEALFQMSYTSPKKK